MTGGGNGAFPPKRSLDGAPNAWGERTAGGGDGGRMRYQEM
jgi:hypothetical protein